MTELSTAPTTSPANSNSDANASPQDAGQTPGAPATATASAVLALLEVAGWTTLHHRETSDRNPVTIDHLAVGPGGVFVIDAHSWTPLLSSTLGADQTAVITAAADLANQVRMLLPPLTRQYVVPLLTYVDASPMSMLRGSIQICTTSMLQGVITSRRPVLTQGEIDDVIASLTNGLRSSSGAASPTSSPSTAPTRRGFLRKGARQDVSAPPPESSPPAAAAPSSVAPEPMPVAPPVFEPPAVLVAAPPAEEAVAVVPEPTFDAPATVAAPSWSEGGHVEAPDVVGEPGPVPQADEPAGVDSWQPGVPPEPEIAIDEAASLADTAAPMTDLSRVGRDDEVQDLAHPVVPTDTSWDLEIEPALEATPVASPAALPAAQPRLDVPTPVEPDDLAHPVVPADTSWDVEAGVEPELDERFNPPAASPLTVAAPPPPPDPVQPSLTAAALSPAVTATPAVQRQPGGRRKAAPPPKSGISRLLPGRAQRPSGRASRRGAAAAVGSDGDSSQEPDLDDLSDDWDSADEGSSESWGSHEPGVEIEPAPLEGEDEVGAEYEDEPSLDFSELDLDRITDVFEPAVATEPEPVPAAEPQQKKRGRAAKQAAQAKPAKEAKARGAKRPLLRRAKEPILDEESDVDLSQMPANLSSRGRQMYVEMQRRPKVEPDPVTTARPAKASRAGAVRKLFVFCVIGGAIGISSSHYDEINTWVSTHVEHLPGLSKIEGPPQPEKPLKNKDKNAKAKQAKNAKADQGRQ